VLALLAGMAEGGMVAIRIGRETDGGSWRVVWEVSEALPLEVDVKGRIEEGRDVDVGGGDDFTVEGVDDLDAEEVEGVGGATALTLAGAGTEAGIEVTAEVVAEVEVEAG